VIELNGAVEFGDTYWLEGTNVYAEIAEALQLTRLRATPEASRPSPTQSPTPAGADQNLKGVKTTFLSGCGSVVLVNEAADIAPLDIALR
jgi:hypothetical protein